MAGLPQIRGMMLEEAILYLLRVSGYRTIEVPGSDPTLQDGPAGLKVKGRGGQHQIDAIADYMIGRPFSYPQRLLVEAKCYATNRRVGIEIIRNAVGVLKDVEEYWVSREYVPLQTRYQYLYSVFSASSFTREAERYAFAQGIYLMPLAESQFMHPIVEAIRRVGQSSRRASDRSIANVNLTSLRLAIRSCLRSRHPGELREMVDDEAYAPLKRFCDGCHNIGGAILGMLSGRFPVFLVPSPIINLADLRGEYRVRIYWDHMGWYLKSAEDGSLLFSFDLPLDLLSEYAGRGRGLPASRAIDLKAEFLDEIQAIIAVEDQIRIVRFHLDREWLNSVRERLQARSSNHEPD